MKIKIGGAEVEVADEVGELIHSQEVRATAAETMAAQAAPVLAAIESATGHKDVGEAIAALAGLKEKAAQADVLAADKAKLQASLDEVAAAKKKAEVTALLDEASKDGRLTPANREKLTAADAPVFAQEPAHLKAYLDMLPKVAQTKGADPVKADDSVVALTDEEKRVAEGQRVSAEHVAVFKAGGPSALRKLLEAEKAAKK